MPKNGSEPAPVASETPCRLTIDIAVADPNDLKVTEGDCLTVNQLIADRSRQRLEQATITPPLLLVLLPAIATPTYLEGFAAIDRAKADVAQAEAPIAVA